jgi:hypothetical protein
MAEENGELDRAAKLAELEKETARLKAERKRIEDERKIEAAERVLEEEKKALYEEEGNTREGTEKLDELVGEVDFSVNSIQNILNTFLAYDRPMEGWFKKERATGILLIMFDEKNNLFFNCLRWGEPTKDGIGELQLSLVADEYAKLKPPQALKTSLVEKGWRWNEEQGFLDLHPTIEQIMSGYISNEISHIIFEYPIIEPKKVHYEISN